MDGIFYFLINFPHLFQLNRNVPFILKWNNINYFVAMREHLTPLEILDFKNTIIETKLDENNSKHDYLYSTITFPEDNVVMGMEKFYTVVDVRSDNISRTRMFTKIILGIECTTSFTKSMASENTDKLLTNFVHHYKLVTGDKFVADPTRVANDILVGKEAYAEYTDFEKKLALKDRLVAGRALKFGIKYIKNPGVFKQIPEEFQKPQENTIKLQKHLETFPEAGISIEQELYIKAMDECYIHSNFRYAILELFLIVEIITTRTLKELKIKRGISNNKLKDFERDIPISYLLNIELPLVLSFAPDQIDTINKVDNLRKLRNGIMHQNISVTEAEVTPFFKVVGDYMKIIYIIHSTM